MKDEQKALFGALLLILPSLQAGTLDKAVQESKAKRYQQSIKLIEKDKQNDAQAEFVLGYNYNRLKKPNEALVHLNKAKALGFRGASFYLERGLAYFQLAQFSYAISDFKHYAKLNPRDLKTYELLGRAYALTGDFNKANYYFEYASQSPSLRHSIAPFRRGMRLFPQLKPRLTQDTDWQVNASLGGGYNSNVVALGNNFALPSDISRQSSPFIEALVYGHKLLHQTEDSAFKFQYQFLGDLYEYVSSLNLANPFFALEYQKQLSPATTFTFNASNNESWLGGNRFSSFLSAKPTLLYKANRWNSFELSYAYSNENFFTPTISVFNRDGFSQFVSISDYIAIPYSALSFHVGYSSNWSSTKGNDFAFHGDDVFIGLQNRLANKWLIEGFYSYGLYRYDNLNSLAGPGGYNFKRRDNLNRYTLQLKKEFSPQTRLYGRYEYFDDNANIPLYSYKQYIVSMGLSMNWS